MYSAGVASSAAPVITRTLKTSPPTTAPTPISEGWKIAMVFKAISGPLHPSAIKVAPATSSGIWKRSLMTSIVLTKYSSHMYAMPQKKYKMRGHHNHRMLARSITILLSSCTSCKGWSEAAASLSASILAGSARSDWRPYSNAASKTIVIVIDIKTGTYRAHLGKLHFPPFNQRKAARMPLDDRDDAPILVLVRCEADAECEGLVGKCAGWPLGRLLSLAGGSVGGG
mmetsp:Transcript_63815/g.152198  ORF Transcript_63815/g.152198 Transcript_63815/m.152198 type:complete len:227 (+) Transcript_63815:1699-2379(+)